MPLSTELTDLLIERLGTRDDDCFDDLLKILNWQPGSGQLNAEQFFDYIQHAATRLKMQHHLDRVGRNYGETSYGEAEGLEYILGELQESLIDVIWHEQQKALARLEPILSFTSHLSAGDAVVSFNYDKLVESALDRHRIPWHHGLEDMQIEPYRVVVLKMHGSVDWVAMKRRIGDPQKMTRLFSKTDVNAEQFSPPPEDREYAYELWRINDAERNDRAIEGRDIQFADRFYDFGIAGLGSFKPLHQLPGSGLVWARAAGALREAAKIIIIGFSLSPFDGMARLELARAMKARLSEKRPPKDIVIVDPNAESLAQSYLSVLQLPVTLVKSRAEEIREWSSVVA